VRAHPNHDFRVAEDFLGPLTKAMWAEGGNRPGPVVVKKMSPCSLLQGLCGAAQEGRYLCVHNRGN
jgi:hypothetical protein